ncbi:MAG: alpha/beta hydrolase [Kiritimatiellae bacterium]|nr:alpha/beta hydrolase [Kiritimatiellia bacterium]
MKKNDRDIAGIAVVGRWFRSLAVIVVVSYLAAFLLAQWFVNGILFPARGIILQSCFISAFRVVTRLPLFPFDRYNNLALLRGLHTPVLILHGEEDRTIPLYHGRVLYAAAAGPKTACWIPDAGHDDLHFVAPDTYWSALQNFIRSTAPLQRKI